jgi:hypothetical protein
VQVGRFLDRAVQTRPKTARALQKALGDGREGHAPGAAVKQRKAHLLFQALQAFGHRWLRDAEPCRCAVDLPLVGHGQKVVDVVQANGHGFSDGLGAKE